MEREKGGAFGGCAFDPESRRVFLETAWCKADGAAFYEVGSSGLRVFTAAGVSSFRVHAGNEWVDVTREAGPWWDDLRDELSDIRKRVEAVWEGRRRAVETEKARVRSLLAGGYQRRKP